MTDELERARQLAQQRKTGRGEQRAPEPAAPRAEPPVQELVASTGVPFPVDVLPEDVREWAIADSESRQVPVEMSATFALMAMMSAAIKHDVQIGPDWREPCVSQMMLVAAPSQRKSPSYKRAFQPVRDHFKKAQDSVERMCTAWGARQKELEVKHSLALKNEESPEAREHAELASKLKDAPKPKRRLAADATPEEFMRLLAENDQTMVLSSDEGDVFNNFGGRYARDQAKLSPLLNGWDCGFLTYDRVGQAGKRVNIVLNAPRAGIAVAAQHKVLTDLTSNPVYRSKGLLARLLYVVLPERTVIEQLCPVSMRPELHQAYERTIERLFVDTGDGPIRLCGCRDQGNGWMQPDWLMDLRARCSVGVIGDGEFQDVPDWAGKLVSNMARLAAVLELCGGGGAQHLARLADFFIAHARMALASSADAPQRGTEHEELSYLVTRLVQVARGRPRGASEAANVASRTFRMRDIQHAARRWKSNAALLPRIDRLVEMGMLTELDAPEARGVGNRAAARRFLLREDLTLDSAVGGWDPARKAASDVPF